MGRVNTIIESAAFSDWLHGLQDVPGKARILARITAAASGNFGDCEAIGQGVSEMRIHYGPGYRVYFKRVGSVVYVLLCGGSKSTQKADIKRAKTLAGKME
jgi:putative addiction module killer protein